MIDRFVTADKKVIAEACEAMRLGKEFKTTVLRPRNDVGFREQHWRGYVTQLARFGDDIQIEINRHDI